MRVTCAYGCSVHGGQKRTIDTLELEELELLVITHHPYLGCLQKQFLALNC